MVATAAQQVIARAMTEKELQANVVMMAKAFGWKVYHPWLSKNSESGFPDLVLLRDGVGLVVELKREHQHPRPDQQSWLDEFAKTCFTANTWHPTDWLSGLIEEVLR